MPQDLLRQCIRVEVGERLSLEAILGHPWLLPNAYSSTLDPTKIGAGSSGSSSSSGLGGLPIPSREHGANKGISHPQVRRVTDACIHPQFTFLPISYYSNLLNLSKQKCLTGLLCSRWTVWEALRHCPRHRRSSLTTEQTRSAWLPLEAVGLLEEEGEEGRNHLALHLRPPRPRPRPHQGLLGLRRVARQPAGSR